MELNPQERSAWLFLYIINRNIPVSVFFPSCCPISHEEPFARMVEKAYFHLKIWGQAQRKSDWRYLRQDLWRDAKRQGANGPYFFFPLVIFPPSLYKNMHQAPITQCGKNISAKIQEIKALFKNLVRCLHREHFKVNLKGQFTQKHCHHLLNLMSF